MAWVVRVTLVGVPASGPLALCPPSDVTVEQMKSIVRIGRTAVLRVGCLWGAVGGSGTWCLFACRCTRTSADGSLTLLLLLLHLLSFSCPTP